MTNNSQEFSFDLYPDIDRDLDDVYRRNLEQGLVDEETATKDTLDAVVEQQLVLSGHETFKDSGAWARKELGNSVEDGVFQKWNKYCKLSTVGRPLGISRAPLTFEGLELDNPNFNEKIEKLYAAKQALTDSGELSSGGVNIGETMHLVAVPWKIMKDNLGSLDVWLNGMRVAQGIEKPDEFNSDLLFDITTYNDWLYLNPKDNGEYLKATEYLDQRIAEDGDWGIILAQTSSMAGLKSLIRPEGFTNTRTPDEMAGKLTVAGQRVDGMGIFEYIALTLQEDPKTISNRDCSWLLANHLRVPGSANENKLPYGRWNEDSVVFGLLPDDYSSALYQPRLAIVDTMPQSSIDLNDLLTGKTTINNKPLPKPPVMRATPPEKRLII
jgi:hypothetical protein